MRAQYLDAKCFDEPHAGPAFPDRWGKPSSRGRDPSPGQIIEHCEAIRSAWDRREEYLRRTLHHVEGVKDAAALFSLGFNALGMPGRQLSQKFSTMFSDVQGGRTCCFGRGDYYFPFPGRQTHVE